LNADTTPLEWLMTFSWFAFFRDVEPLPPLEPETLEGIAALLRAMPGLRQGLVLSPTPMRTDHPFPDNEPSPALALQLQFDTIEALEAALARGGPLQQLGDAGTHTWLLGRSPTQQAMLTRRFGVPDGRLRTDPGELPCSYLVHYPGPAVDLNAWHAHYNTNHPPLMARFPGVRLIEIYTRIDSATGLEWPREDMMQRNKLMFDSPEALTAALLSPVLQDMRADFQQFPPFEGGNVHYVLQTRIVRPRT
jgi:uncharacterized protein (TIGR02118 family)